MPSPSHAPRAPRAADQWACSTGGVHRGGKQARRRQPIGRYPRGTFPDGHPCDTLVDGCRSRRKAAAAMRPLFAHLWRKFGADLDYPRHATLCRLITSARSAASRALHAPRPGSRSLRPKHRACRRSAPSRAEVRVFLAGSCCVCKQSALGRVPGGARSRAAPLRRPLPFSRPGPAPSTAREWLPGNALARCWPRPWWT